MTRRARPHGTEPVLERQFVADRGDERLRLDQAVMRHLADEPGVSRTRVQRWLDAGLISGERQGRAARLVVAAAGRRRRGDAAQATRPQGPRPGGARRPGPVRGRVARGGQQAGGHGEPSDGPHAIGHAVQRHAPSGARLGRHHLATRPRASARPRLVRRAARGQVACGARPRRAPPRHRAREQDVPRRRAGQAPRRSHHHLRSRQDLRRSRRASASWTTAGRASPGCSACARRGRCPTGLRCSSAPSAPVGCTRSVHTCSRPAGPSPAIRSTGARRPRRS